MACYLVDGRGSGGQDDEIGLEAGVLHLGLVTTGLALHTGLPMPLPLPACLSVSGGAFCGREF